MATHKSDINTFPYAQDPTIAPYTDGLIPSGGLDTTTFLPPLGASSSTPQAEHKLSGQFCKEYIGNTSMVFATNISNAQSAGDS
jgi:hypothetical protein